MQLFTFLLFTLPNLSACNEASSLGVVDLRVSEAEIAAQIREAATTIGFFYLTGHNVSIDLQQQVFSLSKQFFSLTEDEKLKYRQDSGHNGYTPFEDETLDTSTQTTRGDTKEGFYIHRELSEDEPYYGQNLPLRLPNHWPDVPNFKSVMQQYYDQLRALALRMNRYLALSLNLPDADYFNQVGLFDRPIAALRLLHYSNEPSNIGDNIYGCGAHTDYGMMTFLLTDGKPGLQIYDKRFKRSEDDKKWTDVGYVENAFVVNIGDELQRWTNDLYLSTRHRVITKQSANQEERYSVAYFWEPNFDCVIECLPGLCDDTNPPKYEPVLHGDHLLYKFDKSYQKKTDEEIKTSKNEL